ncbi:hypothetical protein O4H49_03465 [Kiloniella laminariae]|uniref:Uncharacterized protein n=1 Tax=Kiloniella laminariae TaxID=454162 RepID=A0ABT4LFD7_9PROT|nr:hypothetical protein [Kiloniella laminariae]MCZ4279821.1 hypothetical protein [Kiloniella laminariae]
MKNRYLSCTSLLLAGTLFPALYPSLAAADSADTFLQWMSNPDVSVANNGNRYTSLVSPTAPLQGAFIVQIDAGISGRVKSWKSWPSLALEPDNPAHPGAWLVFENDGDSASYSRPRPKSVNTAAPFFLDSDSYGFLAVEACNAEAARLAGQGLDNSAIFAQNREAKIAVRGNLDYSTTGITGQQTPEEVDSWNAFKAITVTCLKRDTSLSPVVQTIEDATLSAQTAQISNISGACEMTLTGQIISAEPHKQVKFRYHDNTGQQSDEKTITTNGFGESSFEHSYPVSADTADGKVRMIGSSHAFLSNWADYEVNCSAAPDELMTHLPPEASLVVAVQKEAIHRGMACPDNLNLIGKLAGRGKSSGAAAILAEGAIKALKAYTIDQEETVFFQGPHSLSWDGLAFMQQSVTFRLNVTNASGDVVDSVEKTSVFTCRPITASPLAGSAADGFAPTAPARQNLIPRPTLRTAPLLQQKQENPQQKSQNPARLKQRKAP